MTTETSPPTIIRVGQIWRDTEMDNAKYRINQVDLGGVYTIEMAAVQQDEWGDGMPFFATPEMLLGRYVLHQDVP